MTRYIIDSRGVSEEMIEKIKEMYGDEIEFCEPKKLTPVASLPLPRYSPPSLKGRR